MEKNNINTATVTINYKKTDTLKNALITQLKICGVEIEGSLFDIFTLDFPEEENPDPIRYSSLPCIIYSSASTEYLQTILLEFTNQSEMENTDLIKSVDFVQEKYKTINKTVIFKTKLVIRRREGGFSKTSRLILGVILDKTILSYKEVFDFVIRHLMSLAETNTGFDNIGEPQIAQYFFYIFQEPWIFQRKYIDDFIAKHHLPKVEYLNELSALFYEGSSNESRVYFRKDGIITVEKLDTLGREEREFYPKKLRMIRKLMEISKRDKVFLYAETDDSQGTERFFVTELVKDIKTNESQGLYIKFMGFMHWRVVIDEKEAVGYCQGKYEINYTEEKQLYDENIDLLGKYSVSIDTKMLKNLVQILKKQKHGTAVIIGDNSIINEADRLCEKNRGVKVSSLIKYDKDNQKWDDDTLLSITSIDGALMMEWDGRCLAIGVIVDGKTTIKGDVGRGARYNSIVNYIEQKNPTDHYIGIIVSEDGMVNIISNYVKMKK